MKRRTAFVTMSIVLGVLIVGLSVFQFVVKPQMIKGFIANAPRPVPAVAVAGAKTENWQARIAAIGTFRAIQGIDISPQVGGVVRSRCDSVLDCTYASMDSSAVAVSPATTQ